MTAIYFSCFKSYLRDHVYGSVRYYLKMKKKICLSDFYCFFVAIQSTKGDRE